MFGLQRLVVSRRVPGGSKRDSPGNSLIPTGNLGVEPQPKHTVVDRNRHARSFAGALLNQPSHRVGYLHKPPPLKPGRTRLPGAVEAKPEEAEPLSYCTYPLTPQSCRRRLAAKPERSLDSFPNAIAAASRPATCPEKPLICGQRRYGHEDDESPAAAVLLPLLRRRSEGSLAGGPSTCPPRRPLGLGGGPAVPTPRRTRGAFSPHQESQLIKTTQQPHRSLGLLGLQGGGLDRVPAERRRNPEGKGSRPPWSCVVCHFRPVHWRAAASVS